MAIGLMGGCLAISLAATSPAAVAAARRQEQGEDATYLHGRRSSSTIPLPRSLTQISSRLSSSRFGTHARRLTTNRRLPSRFRSTASLSIARRSRAAVTESEERIAAALPPAATTEPPAEAWPKEATIPTEVSATESETPTSQSDKPQLVAANDDILPLPAEPDSGSSEPNATVAAVPEQVSPESTSPESQSTELVAATRHRARARLCQAHRTQQSHRKKTPPPSPPTAPRWFPTCPSPPVSPPSSCPPCSEPTRLAQRGSLYAAQTEFIQVLRRIAQAKDADEGYDDHSRALAAGLRALDEADDFAPSGVQLEAEMNVAVTVSSHRTPVLRDCSADVLPQEAIAQYHCYAQQQLAIAVEGEQAGSMALHGLGKVNCRLAEETPNDSRHDRKAMTMFLAALDAGPQNNLAANEVGVLLSRDGHQAEAAAMFKRAIDLAPSSTAYRNLAVAEQKLGQTGPSRRRQPIWRTTRRPASARPAPSRAASASSGSRRRNWPASPNRSHCRPARSPIPMASRPTTRRLAPRPAPPAATDPHTERPLVVANFRRRTP